ncbi:alpha-amylase [Rathayibacter sp. Leaf296]|nr:alpha-amylase [Rathayibacter sp. Leaf296]
MARPSSDAAALSSGWWSDAVIYQIYPRSFSDSNGDGIGDLAGMIDRLPYLSGLGVDAIWLSPFYPSAGADAGYDVSDPRAIDPVFGTLSDFDELVHQAHATGIRVIVDIVPNHTSSEHRWFTEALLSTPGSAARERYIFRPGCGDGPPNDWESVFGGPAWTRVEGEDQWYLHLYDSRQPDLNWRNPEVRDEYEDVLRFWLDRGVDGFRIDVAHGLIKAEGLPDLGGRRTNAVEAGGDVGPMWDQDEVHDIYRSWRQLLEEYGDDRILVAEAWTTPDRLSRYIRPDEMHQAFNFAYLSAGWDAKKVSAIIESSLATTAEVGATTTWVLSNHDVVRVASRLGQADPNHWSAGIGAADPQPDLELGRRRAAAYALLTLALPGGVYIYQGEELGLPDHTELDNSRRQDPSYRRTAGAVIGRDGCRVPMPWITEAPGHGFGADPWLPQPDTFRHLAADNQVDDPSSFLNLYTTALRIRRDLTLGKTPITSISESEQVLHVVKDTFAVLINFSTVPASLDIPSEGTILLASAPDAYSRGILQGDSAVWIQLSS